MSFEIENSSSRGRDGTALPIRDLMVVFRLKTRVFTARRFLHIFAIARTFKQKCGVLWLLGGAVVRAGFEVLGGETERQRA